MKYHAKKRFGQHFLHERYYIDRIVETAGVQTGDKVFEIGPGLGALTRALHRHDIQLQLIEVDRDIIEYIRTTWPDVPLHEGSACDVDWKDLLVGPDWKCVSNLPYNVGTGIVTELVAQPSVCQSLTVMLQLEVAQRMTSRVGDRNRGSLSAYIECFAEAEIAFKVPAGAFSPPPKVSSAVLHIRVRQNPRVPIVQKTHFENLLKVLYAKPRKTIRKCL